MSARTILYLSYLGGLGGGESSLLSNLDALDRAEFQPRVICGTPGAFVDELRARGIAAEVMPFRLPHFRGIAPVASFDFFPRLNAYLNAFAPSLIHCNDPESAYYVALLAKLRRIPVVWTCWSWWQAERGWKSVFYEKFLTRIITPTRYLKKCLTTTNARLEKKISVLPFGVDTHLFSPGARDETFLREFQIDASAPLVTLLARFQSVKGHENFLNAAPKILDAFSNARFLFVGDTAFETDDANETRRMTRERVLGDARLRAAVIFCGFRRDIPRILRASSLLVCPSDFETYGMANLEAMACGIPVISTNVGGPSETIIDGATGFLVPPRDADALAARVNQLLGDSALRARMGAHARARVEQAFALRDSVARLQEIYRALLK
jgi:glycosyltransferase involved in cell wall biosynthesis